MINGAGSAGISICKLLLALGIGNVVLVDKNGALCPGEDWMNPAQAAMAEVTNKDKQTGALAEIMKGKDVFIGVSAPNIVTAEMVASMANDPIVFAMANPTPEIMPEEAKKGGVRVMATGRLIIQTRSTTCLYSLVFSVVRWMRRQRQSQRR